MFDPMERGRQIREERQQRGCGFCGLADEGQKGQPYQRLNPSPQVADKLRTIADNTPLDKIRKSSASNEAHNHGAFRKSAKSARGETCG